MVGRIGSLIPSTVVRYSFAINSVDIIATRTAFGSDTIFLNADVRYSSNSSSNTAGASIIKHSLYLGNYTQGTYIPSDRLRFTASRL